MKLLSRDGVCLWKLHEQREEEGEHKEGLGTARSGVRAQRADKESDEEPKQML